MDTKETVEHTLKQLIVSGQYAIGAKLPTETALLQQFNVSRYGLRQALQRLSDQGYIRAVQGSGFFVSDPRTKKPRAVDQRAIGVIATHIADYIFPPIISGIDSVISVAGYTMMLSNTHNHFDNEQRSLTRLSESGVDGLIIEPTQSALSNPNMALYRRLALAGMPVVFINAAYPELDFPALTVADTSGEQALVDYLFAQGHRRILGVFQIDDQQGVDRMQGFVRAYQRAGEDATLGNLLLYQSGDDRDLLKTRLTHVIEAAGRPTAIACYNDQLAIRVMAWLRELGVKVPGQISVVGFDDYELSQYLMPALTTAIHPKRQLGELAAQMLLNQIQGISQTSRQMSLTLAVRNSVLSIDSNQ